MDTLVALGSTTAFGYSAWAFLAGWPGHLYFMEAASIITLISVGHWIEARVSEKAASSLKALMTLAPETARRLESRAPKAKPTSASFNLLNSSFKATTPAATEWVEVEIPVAQLWVGDRVVLRPGDRVPVDGEVVEGESAVDEAMLTGESNPVEKSVQSLLYAGTTNLNGRLVMRVTATGESTALAHIIAAVQRAQNSRAEIQRLGDRVSNVFVPIVALVALGTALWWGLAFEHAKQLTTTLAPFLWHAHPPASPLAAAVIAAAAVLIVACPCAMGLATPAAIMAAANAAARRGILIRDGVALEKAGKITAVIFDKTGTLTSGELAFTGPWTPEGSKDSAAMAYEMVASLTKFSNHPVSKAFAGLTQVPLKFESAQEIAGAGIEAQWRDGHGEMKKLRFGSLNWLQRSAIVMPVSVEQFELWKNEGASLVGLAVDEKLAAVFAVRDWIKKDVFKVVQSLRRGGLKAFLLTGDNRIAAAKIAREAGIPPENVFAEVRPEQKAEFVKQLQKRGERVAFVGDGINDAPALTQADLGIAVSRASDVAREAADIILLKSEIEAVPESLGLARAALRTIKQNLFWAFFYNVASIPLAALGFMSPVLCAAAMGFSDLVVIGNALRLRSWKSK
jgi:Cu+-exporting ATPase